MRWLIADEFRQLYACSIKPFLGGETAFASCQRAYKKILIFSLTPLLGAKSATRVFVFSPYFEYRLIFLDRRFQVSAVFL